MTLHICTSPAVWTSAADAHAALNGPTWQTALSAPPRLTLTFYDVGIILQKRDETTGVCHEYAVDPDHLAAAIGSGITLRTGLLEEDIIYMSQQNGGTTLVSYRKPQKTGLYLEGVPDPLRVPLPGLLMIRTSEAGKTPVHHVFAVKKRPAHMSCPLFYPPLPNVYNSGKVCWGNIAVTAEQSISLQADWRAFLSTAFGNHEVSRRSQREPGDVRKLLIALNDANKRAFPKSDLVSAKRTLGDLLESEE